MTGQAKAWLATKAILGGAAIAIIGGLIWLALLAMNLGSSPRLPWSIPVMALLLLLGWRVIGRRRWTIPGVEKDILAVPHGKGRAINYLTGLAAGFAGFLALTLIVQRLALPVASLPSGAEKTPALSLSYFAMASIVAALSEEAGFRGVMQSGLSTAFGKPIVYAVVALCFALLHAGSPTMMVLFPVYIALSLAFSLVVDWAGSIWPTVAGHALANFLSYCLLLVSSGAS